MKHFTEQDVANTDTTYLRIYCDRTDLLYDPPVWMSLGMSETRTGYGRRLNSGLKIHYCGRLYRLYTTIFSNAGSTWFTAKGRKIYVD